MIDLAGLKGPATAAVSDQLVTVSRAGLNPTHRHRVPGRPEPDLPTPGPRQA
jgi:hypothetical protein